MESRKSMEWLKWIGVVLTLVLGYPLSLSAKEQPKELYENQ